MGSRLEQDAKERKRDWFNMILVLFQSLAGFVQNQSMVAQVLILEIDSWF